MSGGRIKAVLFLIVFVLAVAILVNALVGLGDKDEPDTTPDPFASTPQATQTVAPTQTPQPSPSAAPTQAPVSTAKPVVTTPVPTVQPSQAPDWILTTPAPSTVPGDIFAPGGTSAPAGQLLGSGSVSSQTGLPIDIRANWTATVLDDQRVKVQVEVQLLSYALQIKASRNAVNVSVGGDYASCDAPEVDYEGSQQLVTTLGVTSHTISLASGQSQTLPLAVEYHFGGSYSGQELPVIECGGSIQISR